MQVRGLICGVWSSSVKKIAGCYARPIRLHYEIECRGEGEAGRGGGEGETRVEESVRWLIGPALKIEQAVSRAGLFDTPLALTVRGLQPVILRLALPTISACRCLLVILLPLSLSLSPGPFRARCEKFTIVCRGTAIAPPRRPPSDKKLSPGIATERPGLTRRKWKLQRFSATLHGGRRNYDRQRQKLQLSVSRNVPLASRHDMLVWRPRDGGGGGGEGEKRIVPGVEHQEMEQIVSSILYSSVLFCCH